MGNSLSSKSWSRASAERIWVDSLLWSFEFSENCPQISQQIYHQIFPVYFSALFLQGFRPPPPKKNHTQNSGPKLSAFLSNFRFLNLNFFHADSRLTGEIKNSKEQCGGKSGCQVRAAPGQRPLWTCKLWHVWRFPLEPFFWNRSRHSLYWDWQFMAINSD